MKIPKIKISEDPKILNLAEVRSSVPRNALVCPEEWYGHLGRRNPKRLYGVLGHLGLRVRISAGAWRGLATIFVFEQGADPAVDGAVPRFIFAQPPPFYFRLAIRTILTPLHTHTL